MGVKRFMQIVPRATDRVCKVADCTNGRRLANQWRRRPVRAHATARGLAGRCPRCRNRSHRRHAHRRGWHAALRSHMSDPVGAALIATMLIAVFGRTFVMRWLMRQHAAGAMSGRKAGWIFAATLMAPSAGIVAFVALSSTGSAVVVALAMLATAPVLVIPWVAIFRYPDDRPWSKRYPPT
jgi:hypothetical protein